MSETSHRVAVVTGGGSGIGRAIAHQLARGQARVVVADILEANAVKVAGEIASHGAQAFGLGCDVSQRDSVKELHAEVSRRFGPASVLVANAGVVMFERLADMSDDDIDWMLHVNLFGVVNCVRAFLPDMMEMRDGHIAAISSQSALLPSFGPPHSAYIAAKAGVVGLMLGLRNELKSSGVDVTVVCPGRVATEITNSPRYRPTRFGGAQNASIELPLQRGPEGFRPPEELARMVLRAIHENRPVVVSDSQNLEMFELGFVAPVRDAFAEAAAFDRSNRDDVGRVENA